MDRSICVKIILAKNKIISANAGDSSAVMGRYINDILMVNGFISCSKDE